MKLKRTTILYFIAGIASEEQIALAQKVGAKIRNSLAYSEGDFVEKCDFVMGDVPKAYSEIEREKADKQAQTLAKKIADAAEPDPKQGGDDENEPKTES